MCEVEETMLQDYIHTALWSTPSEEEALSEHLDEDFSIEDIDEDVLEELSQELCIFVNKFYGLVDDSDGDRSYGAFVHNVWLTRNGHGAGFWDGDYKNGAELTQECEKLSQINLYVGDDGKIYK